MVIDLFGRIGENSHTTFNLCPGIPRGMGGSKHGGPMRINTADDPSKSRKTSETLVQ